jgi:hypothetical protein
MSEDCELDTHEFTFYQNIFRPSHRTASGAKLKHIANNYVGSNANKNEGWYS